MVAVPRVTEVFWNTMFDRSPRPTSPAGRVFASLGTGALSPVRADSCVSNVAERRIRPSAGTMSPDSSWTISPGTSSTAGSETKVPSRTTFACGTCSFDSASTLALAFSSCLVPKTTFSPMSMPTITPVETSPMRKLTTTTATSMRFIGSRSWLPAIAHTEGGFAPAIWFAPYFESRFAASAAVRPAEGSDPTDATTPEASRA